MSINDYAQQLKKQTVSLLDIARNTTNDLKRKVAFNQKADPANNLDDVEPATPEVPEVPDATKE